MMKKLLCFLIIVSIIFIGGYIFRDNITEFVFQKMLDDVEISELKPNEYYRATDYSYVQITNDFEAKNYNHLMNIYYTIVNSGMESFIFKCDYDECIKDVEDISNNQILLSNINSFVHPYNNFSSIATKFDSLGIVELTINKQYSDKQIKELKLKSEEIIKNVVGTTSNSVDIIRKIHDYIIINTKYDSDRSDLHKVNYSSDIAYGPLIEGYGLCGGYSDAMSIFLDYYNIPNFKIISENHAWNAVKINNKWYHLDLTWDDPITTSGKDVLKHDYFLINTQKLYELESIQHNFDKEVFKEIAN